MATVSNISFFNATPYPNGIIAQNSWTITQTVTCIMCFLVCCTNLFLLNIYRIKPALRTPFGVYVIVISISNICFVICTNPLALTIKNVLPTSYASVYCTVYNYFGLVVGAALPMTHMLISLNRGWAIAFPVHYTRHHSRRIAILICGIGLLAINLGAIPGMAIDGLFYRTEGLNVRCNLSTAPSVTIWIRCMAGLFFMAPEGIIVLSYPFLVFRQICHRTRIQNGSQQTEMEGNVSTVPSTCKHVHSRKKASRSFLVLTLMTASVLLSWTPSNMFHLLIRYVKADVVFPVGNALKLIQALLDPILFIVALKDLRSSSAGQLRDIVDSCKKQRATALKN